MFLVYDWEDQVQEVIGMFQKEVAQRIASKSGSKVYGILSVLMQTYSTVILMTLKSFLKKYTIRKSPRSNVKQTVSLSLKSIRLPVLVQLTFVICSTS
jgi:hypothetical protein